MSSQCVRDYVRGWTAYHSGPDADVDTLTDRVCNTLRPDPTHRLTYSTRRELEAALGTKDAVDARTLVDITQDVLSEYLASPCSHRTAQSVAQTVLNVYETGWDLTATMPLPSALATAYEDLLARDLTSETAQRLVAAHIPQSGSEFSQEQ